MQGEMKSISYNMGVEMFMYAIVGTHVDFTCDKYSEQFMTVLVHHSGWS